jgi:HNH endonuclease
MEINLNFLIKYGFKRCTKCQALLLRSPLNFYLQRSGADGLTAHCRKCGSAAVVRHYHANRDRILQAVRAHRAANPGYGGEAARRWYLANIDRVKEYNRRWLAAQREKPPVTAGRLWELLKYDPVTGVFTRRVRAGSRVAGSIAGRLSADGYWYIGIDGRLYRASHLAWLYMTDRWPAEEVDHRDVNPGNNSWENLREATRIQNQANKRSYGALGVKGVRRYGAKFQAEIRAAGQYRYLGTFPTAEAASEAYARAAVEAWGEFARF